MIQGVPSFKGFHMTEKGKERLASQPVDFIQQALLPAAKMAKEDKKNCLSVEDDGRIYIETPEYGKFTVNNPADAKVNGTYFSCDVRTPKGEVNRIYVPFEKDIDAEQFKKESFGFGAYIPRMNLDLYKAIVAADAYKSSLIDELSAFSD